MDEIPADTEILAMHWMVDDRVNSIENRLVRAVVVRFLVQLEVDPITLHIARPEYATTSFMHSTIVNCGTSAPELIEAVKNQLHRIVGRLPERITHTTVASRDSQRLMCSYTAQ